MNNGKISQLFSALGIGILFLLFIFCLSFVLVGFGILLGFRNLRLASRRPNRLLYSIMVYPESPSANDEDEGAKYLSYGPVREKKRDHA